MDVVIFISSMAKDYKTRQLRSSQIILSGSVDDSYPNLAGIFYKQSSAVDTTGAFNSDLLDPVGQDVSLFFSGSISEATDQGLFGGDIAVSGTTILSDAIASSIIAEQPMSSSGMIISQDSSESIFLSGSTNDTQIRISPDRPSEIIIEAATGSLYFLGGRRFKTTDANVATYTLTGADEYYIQDRYTLTGSSTLNLPEISDNGRAFIIKDSGGNAATNNITINQSGSDTIDGSSSAYILNNNYESLSLFSNFVTNNWEITARFSPTEKSIYDKVVRTTDSIAALITAGNTTLLLEPGTHTISTTLALTSTTIIHGLGPEVSTLLISTDNKVITATTGSLVLANLCIDATAITTAANHAVHFSGTSLKVTDVKIRSYSTCIHAGDHTVTMDRVFLKGNDFLSTNQYAVNVVADREIGLVSMASNVRLKGEIGGVRVDSNDTYDIVRMLFNRNIVETTTGVALLAGNSTGTDYSILSLAMSGNSFESPENTTNVGYDLRAYSLAFGTITTAKVAGASAGTSAFSESRVTGVTRTRTI